MDSMNRWKEFRYWMEELGCLFLAWGVPKLSRRACVRLANGLGHLASQIDRRGRTVALDNLACAFGDRYTPRQRLEITRASYQNFVRTMLDLFWAQRLTADNFQQWIEVEGFEAFRDHLRGSQRGSITMCVHQGNWEWASLAFGFLGLSGMIVAETFKNPRLTALFARLREISGQKLIPQENSVLRLLKAVKRGGYTGMLIDLNLPPSQAATAIEAFGMKMCVPLLHTVLAQRGNALLAIFFTEPQPDGRCRVIARPMVEISAEMSPAQIAQRCWDAFEPQIRARPELYLWAYKHFRYKPRETSTRYPAYANTSGKFEQLLGSVHAVATTQATGRADKSEAAP
jgi:lauroyl/myristoyl acyltransferase